jgi:hypothetical protein
MMQTFKVGARVAYLREERERMDNAATLTATFKQLSSLTAELAFFGPDRRTQWSKVKYKVNLDHAKTVFRFDCPSRECVKGDFDLTEVLSKAIASRRKIVLGEVTCEGWRTKGNLGKVPCGHVLRYKLTLGYKKTKAARA